MKYTKNRFARYWLPLIVYCLLIYIQASLPVPSYSLRHLDKVIHFGVYTVLGMLVFRAFRSVLTGSNRIPAVLMTLVVSAVIGISDEVRQIFIPSRSIDREDFMYDMLGAVCGVIICLIVYRFRNRAQASQGESFRDESSES